MEGYCAPSFCHISVKWLNANTTIFNFELKENMTTFSTIIMSVKQILYRLLDATKTIESHAYAWWWTRDYVPGEYTLHMERYRSCLTLIDILAIL